LHLDLISDMRRMHSLFCSTAYSVLDEAGMLRRSRMDIGEDPVVVQERQEFGDYSHPP
jgi:phosphate:Na+ symporter